MSVGYIKDKKLVTCATKDDVGAAVAAEAALREAADQLLSEEIAVERSERYSTDQSLSEEIAVERSERYSADNELRSKIDVDYTVGSDGTYYVYTVAGLQAWAEACAGDMSTGCVLMCSLDMSGVAWTPIGDGSNSYTGCFEGAGKAIYNLTVSVTGSEGTVRAGFFGYLGAEAEVNSLTLNKCSIKAEYTGDSSSSYRALAGGIAGQANSTANITSCTVTKGSHVEAIGGIGYAHAGGIAGYGATVTDSINSGSIYATTDSNSARAGGIIGAGGNATGSTNIGSIYATSNSYNARAGGILGSGDTVTGCINRGSVYATSNSSTAYAGGIIGYFGNSSTYCNSVLSCYSSASADSIQSSGGSSSTGYAGGIAGYMYNNSTCYTVIQNCVVYETPTGGSVNGSIFGGRSNETYCLSNYNTLLQI